MQIKVHLQAVMQVSGGKYLIKPLSTAKDSTIHPIDKLIKILCIKYIKIKVH